MDARNTAYACPHPNLSPPSVGEGAHVPSPGFAGGGSRMLLPSTQSGEGGGWGLHFSATSIN